MSTLLRIDSSPFRGEASFSRHLTGEFAAHWQKTNPEGQVIVRDLSLTALAPVNAEWVAAVYTPEAMRTPEQKEILAVSDALVTEFLNADAYVFGVAMHNFSIPSILKLWLDQIARVGKTFSYEGGVPTGLVKGKKATFLVASGGVYEQGTPAASMNFVEPYLRSVFSFIGVKDVTFINAGGTSRARAGVDRQVILQPALASIRAQFQAA